MGCDLAKWLARWLPRCGYPIRISAEHPRKTNYWAAAMRKNGPPYIIAVPMRVTPMKKMPTDGSLIELYNVYLDYETAWIRRGRLRPVPHPPVHCRLQDAQRKEEECRTVSTNYCFIFYFFQGCTTIHQTDIGIEFFFSFYSCMLSCFL
jgi:hypothetical protein